MWEHVRTCENMWEHVRTELRSSYGTKEMNQFLCRRFNGASTVLCRCSAAWRADLIQASQAIRESEIRKYIDQIDKEISFEIKELNEINQLTWGIWKSVVFDCSMCSNPCSFRISWCLGREGVGPVMPVVQEWKWGVQRSKISKNKFGKRHIEWHRTWWNTVEHSSTSQRVWRLPAASSEIVAIVAIVALFATWFGMGKPAGRTVLSQLAQQDILKENVKCVWFVFFLQKAWLGHLLRFPGKLDLSNCNRHGIIGNHKWVLFIFTCRFQVFKGLWSFFTFLFTIVHFVHFVHLVHFSLPWGWSSIVAQAICLLKDSASPRSQKCSEAVHRCIGASWKKLWKIHDSFHDNW